MLHSVVHNCILCVLQFINFDAFSLFSTGAKKEKETTSTGKSLIIDELSQKEREVYDASLKKESEIRERLQEVCFLFFLSLPCVQGSSTTWKSVISFDLWIYVLRNGVPWKIEIVVWGPGKIFGYYVCCVGNVLGLFKI